MEKTELTYIYDPETGYPIQVTPEQRKRYLELWGMSAPRIDGVKGRIAIYGTPGSLDTPRINLWDLFLAKQLEIVPPNHFVPLIAEPPADMFLKPPVFNHPLNIRPWQQRRKLCRLRKKPSLLRRKLSKAQRPGNS